MGHNTKKKKNQQRRIKIIFYIQLISHGMKIYDKKDNINKVAMRFKFEFEFPFMYVASIPCNCVEEAVLASFCMWKSKVSVRLKNLLVFS